MDWLRQIDGYCERLGPGYWAEPVNALTNLAFLIVAAWLWPASRGVERVLCAILAAIGVGSWLFHTHATAWAAMADTTPIGLFILTYVFATHRRLFVWGRFASGIAVAAFIPYLAAAGSVFSFLPGFSVSAAYWPVPLAIALYGLAMRTRLPRVAREFWIGSGILTLSLVLRSLDQAVCGVVPLGTHFAWHLLNAVMLGWMITVLRRDRLERRSEPR